MNLPQHIIKTILSVICGVFFVFAQAQDPLFTQFYANPTYISPAFAGTSIQSRFAANYRNQWPGIPKPIISYSAA